MNKDRSHHQSILDDFLKDVSRIADKEYQRRVWINALGPECDDFGETVNFIFDGGEPILNHYCDFNITESQRILLTKFLQSFDEFIHTDYCTGLAIDFIDIPEWTHITEMAQEVLKAFNWKPNK